MEQKRFLLKAPNHLLHIEALLKVFPDAQLIFTHRRLSEIVPSFLSLTKIAMNDVYGGVEDLKWRDRFVTTIHWVLVVRHELGLRDRHCFQGLRLRFFTSVLRFCHTSSTDGKKLSFCQCTSPATCLSQRVHVCGLLCFLQNLGRAACVARVRSEDPRPAGAQPRLQQPDVRACVL